MYYPLCKKDRLEVLKIVGIYALFGALWIYFSDATLGWLVRDPDTITLLATYKGLLFIVVTAFLLYGLVSRYIFREAESRQQIEKSEERKRLFFEQKLFGMGISSPEKEWIQFNDTLCEMLGYSREEFEQLRCEEMTHPKDMARSNVMFGRLIAGELNEYSFEKRYIRKDGTVLYVDLSATSVRRPDGSVDYVLVVLSDITEKKRAEKAMRNSEERFRTLVDTIPDPIWLKDADGVYLACNKMFARLFGAREEDILGKTDYDFVDRELADFFRLHDRKAMEAGKPTSNEEWVTFADDGHRALLDTIKTPMSDAEGKLVGVLGIARDISERKRAEDEKLHLESQLRQAQKMEAIGTLAGGIAHDFNNILSIIFGYNELAMEEKDPEERQRHLEELHKGAVRAKELVKQILTFSRKTEQEPQPLRMSLIVKEALKMLRASIPSTIEIKQNIASSGLVLADPTQIHQVIMNLCTNAAHAMRETGGILAVSLAEVKIGAKDYGYADLAPGDYLKLEVSDTGCGIEPKILEKIFEPYFTTKKFGEGTGMGLAVVHGIVKSHHGHITVYSEAGKGTSFHVYLPLTEQQIAVALPDRTPPKELRGTGERVLFVDDEAQIRGVVEAILSKNGYQVTTCADGMQAWEEFQKAPDQFALVLTDMTMPFMTGGELAQKILALRPQTPVILCTGLNELINREKALAMEIRDYLHKPVQMEQLLVAVKKALEKR